MGLITRLNDYLANTDAVGSEVRADFDQIIDLLNGNLDDQNISASAGIQQSKINNLVSDLADINNDIATVSAAGGANLSGVEARVATLCGTSADHEVRISTLSGEMDTHQHTGADGTLKINHANLSGVLPDQHHDPFTTISGDSGSATPDGNDSIKIVGGTGADVTASGSTVTITASGAQGTGVMYPVSFLSSVPATATQTLAALGISATDNGGLVKLSCFKTGMIANTTYSARAYCGSATYVGGNLERMFHTKPATITGNEEEYDQFDCPFQAGDTHIHFEITNVTVDIRGVIYIPGLVRA